MCGFSFYCIIALYNFHGKCIFAIYGLESGLPVFERDNDIPEPERIIPHNGIASLSILSLISFRRIGRVATSTCLPRSSSSSYESPPRSKRVLPGSSVTRRSISLVSMAFLFATEPNTLISRTPYRTAILLISLLFSFSSSYTSISHHPVRCTFTPLIG